VKCLKKAILNQIINVFFQASYEALPTEQKATLLFSSLPATSGVADDGRQLAAVMLRRLLTSEFQVQNLEKFFSFSAFTIVL
jgi:hypothetical protein